MDCDIYLDTRRLSSQCHSPCILVCVCVSVQSNEGVESTGVPGSGVDELQHRLEESAQEISTHHATIETLVSDMYHGPP